MKEAYEASKVIQKKCDEMCRKMQGGCSDAVTVEQIEAVTQLLGL